MDIILCLVFPISIAIYWRWSYIEKSNLQPSVFLSLGILFTFIGITYSLFIFDPENIQASMPKFLEGMKTAFVSSVIGMILSIIVSIINKSKEQKQYSQDDPLPILKSIDNNSLKMIEALNLFGEKLTQSATQEIVKALRKVVADFDSNLSEHVTNTFQELKKSTDNLINWQEVNKVVMQEMIDNNKILYTEVNVLLKKSTENTNKLLGIFNKMDEHLKSLVNSWANITEYSDRFLENSNKISETQNEYLTNIANTSEQLDKIEKSISKISLSTDVLQEHSENLLKGFSKYEALSAKVDETYTKVNNSFNILSDSLEDIDKSLTVITVSVEELDNHSKKISNQNQLLNNTFSDIEKISNLLNNSLPITVRTLEDLAANVNQSTISMNEMAQEFQKSVKVDLSNALNASLNTLSSAMASITEKFAEDYIPLAERLNEVLKIAEKNTETKGE